MYEDACSRLHSVLNDLPRYSFAQLDDQVPADGVYFLFEVGEEGHGATASYESGATQGKETSLLGCESMCASTKTAAFLGSTLGEHCFSEIKTLT